MQKSVLFAACSLLVAALVAVPAAAQQTLYVSDVLTVPLRSGPSNAHRILHRGLPSGTRLTLLSQDEDAGYTEVRLENGTEGWLPSQYLVAEPIARDRLEAANRRISTLQSELTSLRDNHQQLRSQHNQATTDNQALQSRLVALEAELLEIRRISADALGQHEETQRLQQLNQRLQTEVEAMVVEIRSLQSRRELHWLLAGGGLLLGGLLLGAWLTGRNKRRGW